jgi:hypothetical protein
MRAARTYAPLVLELVGLALAVAVFAALAALTFVQAALVLLVAPTGAGVWNWARRWSPPRSRWRVEAAARRRRVELVDAIDRAPHRHGRGAHEMYGVFVETKGPGVAVALVRRPPGPRRGRAERTTVVDERRFAGDQVEDAAAWLAELEERAAAAERHERERLAAQRDEAQRARVRDQRAAEDARLHAIDEAHQRETARREAQLHAEDQRAREHEERIEAEALARALRRR